ncbi:MAG: sodium:proton antiporter [Bacteroidetes bacterium 46-16]|nr:MAG: sodium:proton antiporter [Bacteroidetes bacterium 46-16]
MILLSALEFSLPLKNPVIIFSLVLFIILFAPILLNKIKVPHIIGLILAGVVTGPYGLDLLRRDSSIVLFGTAGLLYIMFLAGLEIDIAEFKRNKAKIFLFGMTTFLLPLIFGTLASYYILDFNFLSSLLLASMFSTHTLVSYPIASKYGVARDHAIALTIGGTMITDVLALLILAGVAGMSKEGASSIFWVQLSISAVIFVCIVFFLFPVVTRWFFKHHEDSVSQYIFVLAMVFLSAFLAEAAGLEAIIGAFFSGLVLNKFVPHSSPLMNRINFVGNALFIPFFLISVGMLVDVSVLVQGWGALKVAGVIIVVAIVTKYIAAKITQKAFGLSPDQGNIIFGLSTSHAAATLAIILVGYNIIIGETVSGEPIRLLNEDVLNGTILLILVSCAISSFVVEKASSNLALLEEKENPEEKITTEKILISLAYPETVSELVDFGLMLKPRKSNIPVYALHVTHDGEADDNSSIKGKKIIDKALVHASATESIILPLTRFDFNVSNGIIYTIKEHHITDILIGLHKQKNNLEFFGPKAEDILNKVSETIYIYKPVQPFNTIKRLIVAVPPKAELETGFRHWFGKLLTISKEVGIPVTFFSDPDTLVEMKILQQQSIIPGKLIFNKFTEWDDFLIFSRELKPNDLFIVISSRKNQLSYNMQLNKLPYYLSSYFQKNSFVILYPKQTEIGLHAESKIDKDYSLLDTISGGIGKPINLFKWIFNKRK